jgi:hypothetical protein
VPQEMGLPATHTLFFSLGRKAMRKLQIEDAEVMRIAIQQEIGRSEG